MSGANNQAAWPCIPAPISWVDIDITVTIKNHMVVPEGCRIAPKPFAVYGWSMADMLNGEILLNRKHAFGDESQLHMWREVVVPSYETVIGEARDGPRCWAHWLTDESHWLVPSHKWHSVLALSDVINVLGCGHRCSPKLMSGGGGDAAIPDNFPYGAIAFLAWERGHVVDVDSRGHVVVPLGINSDTLQKFQAKMPASMGWTQALCEAHLLATEQEGGAA